MHFSKAKESLQAAEACFELGLHNSVANRAYYAMFQAIAVALKEAGYGRDEWSHEGLQRTFSVNLTRRQKIYPHRFAAYLSDGLAQRNIADYRDADISEKRVTRILDWAREVVGEVEEVIGYVNTG